jgi:hypothetical protein
MIMSLLLLVVHDESRKKLPGGKFASFSNFVSRIDVRKLRVLPDIIAPDNKSDFKDRD